MTPRQIALVQSSFAQVLPIAETAAGMFYARLFELAPQVRPMFKGDIAEQGRKLMAMLRTVVANLDKPDVLVPAAQQLARRHVAYGVQEAHYAIVGAALLDTLAAGLGRAGPCLRCRGAAGLGKCLRHAVHGDDPGGGRAGLRRLTTAPWAG